MEAFWGHIGIKLTQLPVPGEPPLELNPTLLRAIKQSLVP